MPFVQAVGDLTDQPNACVEFVVVDAVVGVVNEVDAADVASLYAAVGVAVAVVVVAVEDDGQYLSAEFGSCKGPTWKQLVVQSDQQDGLKEVVVNLQPQA